MSEDYEKYGKESMWSVSDRLSVAMAALPACIEFVGVSGNRYQRAAQMAVNYADALLHEIKNRNELENSES